MNGRQWRISIYAAMLEYGEDIVTGDQVVAMAKNLFPKVQYPPWPDDAEWELRQTRKLIAFTREGIGVCPTLMDRLSWALGTGGSGMGERKLMLSRDMKTRMGIKNHPGGGSSRPSINDSEWDHVRKCISPKSCTA